MQLDLSVICFCFKKINLCFDIQAQNKEKLMIITSSTPTRTVLPETLSTILSEFPFAEHML